VAQLRSEIATMESSDESLEFTRTWRPSFLIRIWFG
jgi:hypothetical protein